MFRKNNLLLRAISLVLVTTFTISDFVWAYPQGQNLTSTGSEIFKAPIEFAHLKYVGKRNSPNLLIHFEDPHSNLSGQENLFKAMNDILRNHKIRLVLVEGGTKDDTLEFIKKMAPKEEVRRVARKFLYEGKIQAEEYLNLTTDHPVKIVGIEDKTLYMQNLKVYGALVDQREEALKYLNQMTTALRKIKQKNYPQVLLAYEKIDENNYEARLEKLLSLKESLPGVMDVELSPELKKLKILSEKESMIDFNLARLELASLIEALEKFSRDKSLSMDRLRGMASANNTKLSQFQLIRSVIQMAQSRNLPIKAYAQLSLYADYLRDYSKLNLERALQEIERLEAQVYSCCLSIQERKISADSIRLIYSVDRYTRLLKLAYGIQMTAEDFKVFILNDPNFSTLAAVGFINKKLAESGYIDDFIPYRDVLDKGKKTLMQFYALTEKRDFAFMKNIEKTMEDAKEANALLITGGYHTNHLKKLIGEKNYSHVVLSPIVMSSTNQTKYEEILLEPLEQAKNRRASSGQGQSVGSSKITEGIRPIALAEGARLGEFIDELRTDSMFVTEESTKGARLAYTQDRSLDARYSRWKKSIHGKGLNPSQAARLLAVSVNTILRRPDLMQKYGIEKHSAGRKGAREGELKQRIGLARQIKRIAKESGLSYSQIGAAMPGRPQSADSISEILNHPERVRLQKLEAVLAVAKGLVGARLARNRASQKLAKKCTILPIDYVLKAVGGRLAEKAQEASVRSIANKENCHSIGGSAHPNFDRADLLEVTAADGKKYMLMIVADGFRDATISEMIVSNIGALFLQSFQRSVWEWIIDAFQYVFFLKFIRKRSHPLQEVMTRMASRIDKLARKSGTKEGSTYSIAIISEEKIVIATLGDSPLMVIYNDDSYDVGAIHNMFNEDEARAIEANTGDGWLRDEPTRFVGGQTIAQNTPWYYPHPDIRTYDREDIQSVVILSDAVQSFNSGRQPLDGVAEEVIEHSGTAESIAEMIYNELKPDRKNPRDKRTVDDTTCVLWRERTDIIPKPLTEWAPVAPISFDIEIGDLRTSHDHEEGAPPLQGPGARLANQRPSQRLAKKFTILLVDYGSVNRGQIREVLDDEFKQVNILTAENTREAINILEERRGEIDLVVANHYMVHEKSRDLGRPLQNHHATKIAKFLGKQRSHIPMVVYVYPRGNGSVVPVLQAGYEVEYPKNVKVVPRVNGEEPLIEAVREKAAGARLVGERLRRLWDDPFKGPALMGLSVAALFITGLILYGLWREYVVSHRTKSSSTNDIPSLMLGDTNPVVSPPPIFLQETNKPEGARLPRGHAWRVVDAVQDMYGKILTAKRTRRMSAQGEDLPGGVLKRAAKRYPDFFQKFGIRSNGRDRLEYPDVQGLNARLERIQDSEFPLYVRFWATHGESGTLETVRHLAARPYPEIVWSQSGTHHFHDLNIHLLAFLIAPKQIMHIIQGKAQVLMAFYELLKRHEAAQQIILIEMEKLVSDVDIYSAMIGKTFVAQKSYAKGLTLSQVLAGMLMLMAQSHISPKDLAVDISRKLLEIQTVQTNGPIKLQIGQIVQDAHDFTMNDDQTLAAVEKIKRNTGWQGARLAKKNRIHSPSPAFMQGAIARARRKFLVEELEFTDEAIDATPTLLWKTTPIIRRNWEFLTITLGVSAEKVKQYSELLGGDPETLSVRWDFLTTDVLKEREGITSNGLAFSEDVVRSLPVLMTLPVSTLAGRWQYLTGTGTSDRDNVIYTNLRIPENRIRRNPSLLTDRIPALALKWEYLTTSHTVTNGGGISYTGLNIPEERARTQPSLLTKDIESIKRNWRYLTTKGETVIESVSYSNLQILEKAVRDCPTLLTAAVPTLAAKWLYLTTQGTTEDEGRTYQNLDLSQTSVRKNPALLALSLENLADTYEFLTAQAGVPKQAIAQTPYGYLAAALDLGRVPHTGLRMRAAFFTRSGISYHQRPSYLIVSQFGSETGLIQRMTLFNQRDWKPRELLFRDVENAITARIKDKNARTVFYRRMRQLRILSDHYLFFAAPLDKERSLQSVVTYLDAIIKNYLEPNLDEPEKGRLTTLLRQCSAGARLAAQPTGVPTLKQARTIINSAHRPQEALRVLTFIRDHKHPGKPCDNRSMPCRQFLRIKKIYGERVYQWMDEAVTARDLGKMDEVLAWSLEGEPGHYLVDLNSLNIIKKRYARGLILLMEDTFRGEDDPKMFNASTGGVYLKIGNTFRLIDPAGSNNVFALLWFKAQGLKSKEIIDEESFERMREMKDNVMDVLRRHIFSHLRILSAWELADAWKGSNLFADQLLAECAFLIVHATDLVALARLFAITESEEALFSQVIEPSEVSYAAARAVRLQGAQKLLELVEAMPSEIRETLHNDSRIKALGFWVGGQSGARLAEKYSGTQAAWRMTTFLRQRSRRGSDYAIGEPVGNTVVLSFGGHRHSFDIRDREQLQVLAALLSIPSTHVLGAAQRFEALSGVRLSTVERQRRQFPASDLSGARLATEADFQVLEASHDRKMIRFLWNRKEGVLTYSHAVAIGNEVSILEPQILLVYDIVYNGRPTGEAAIKLSVNEWGNVTHAGIHYLNVNGTILRDKAILENALGAWAEREHLDRRWVVPDLVVIPREGDGARLAKTLKTPIEVGKWVRYILFPQLGPAEVVALNQRNATVRWPRTGIKRTYSRALLEVTEGPAPSVATTQLGTAVRRSRGYHGARMAGLTRRDSIKLGFLAGAGLFFPRFDDVQLLAQEDDEEAINLIFGMSVRTPASGFGIADPDSEGLARKVLDLYKQFESETSSNSAPEEVAGFKRFYEKLFNLLPEKFQKGLKSNPSTRDEIIALYARVRDFLKSRGIYSFYKGVQKKTIGKDTVYHFRLYEKVFLVKKMGPLDVPIVKAFTPEAVGDIASDMGLTVNGEPLIREESIAERVQFYVRDIQSARHAKQKELLERVDFWDAYEGTKGPRAVITKIHQAIGFSQFKLRIIKDNARDIETETTLAAAIEEDLHAKDFRNPQIQALRRHNPREAERVRELRAKIKLLRFVPWSSAASLLMGADTRESDALSTRLHRELFGHILRIIRTNPEIFKGVIEIRQNIEISEEVQVVAQLYALAQSAEKNKKALFYVTNELARIYGYKDLFDFSSGARLASKKKQNIVAPLHNDENLFSIQGSEHPNFDRARLIEVTTKEGRHYTLMMVADGFVGENTSEIIVSDVAKLFIQSLKPSLLEFLKESLGYFLIRLAKGKESHFLEIVMRRLAFKIDRLAREKGKDTGSTYSIAAISEDKIVTATLGDSPLMVIKKDGELKIGQIHTTDDADEDDRVSKKISTKRQRRYGIVGTGSGYPTRFVAGQSLAKETPFYWPYPDIRIFERNDVAGVIIMSDAVQSLNFGKAPLKIVADQVTKHSGTAMSIARMIYDSQKPTSTKFSVTKPIDDTTCVLWRNPASTINVEDRALHDSDPWKPVTLIDLGSLTMDAGTDGHDAKDMEPKKSRGARLTRRFMIKNELPHIIQRDEYTLHQIAYMAGALREPTFFEVTIRTGSHTQRRLLRASLRQIAGGRLSEVSTLNVLNRRPGAASAEYAGGRLLVLHYKFGSGFNDGAAYVFTKEEIRQGRAKFRGAEGGPTPVKRLKNSKQLRRRDSVSKFFRPHRQAQKINRVLTIQGTDLVDTTSHVVFLADTEAFVESPMDQRLAQLMIVQIKSMLARKNSLGPESLLFLGKDHSKLAVYEGPMRYGEGVRYQFITSGEGNIRQRLQKLLAKRGFSPEQVSAMSKNFGVTIVKKPASDKAIYEIANLEAIFATARITARLHLESLRDFAGIESLAMSFITDMIPRLRSVSRKELYETLKKLQQFDPVYRNYLLLAVRIEKIPFDDLVAFTARTQRVIGRAA